MQHTVELIANEPAHEAPHCLFSRLASRKKEFSFEDDPDLFVQVASLGIHQEVSVLSNELAGAIFDAETRVAVSTENMRSQRIRYRNAVGVKIWAEGSSKLEIRLKGLKELIHPEFSCDSNGDLVRLVIFPESVAQIASLKGIELVILPEWAKNTVFGGFSKDTHYYQANLWEIENNDALRFARLLAQKKLAFIGTHDLTSHVSGATQIDIERLAVLAQKTAKALEAYFSASRDRPNSRASLIIPYLIGFVLDDLAQPVNYKSMKHEHMLDLLIGALGSIDPASKARVFRFPPSFDSLIRFIREETNEEVLENGHARIRALVHDIKTGLFTAP